MPKYPLRNAIEVEALRSHGEITGGLRRLLDELDNDPLRWLGGAVVNAAQVHVEESSLVFGAVVRELLREYRRRAGG